MVIDTNAFNVITVVDINDLPWHLLIVAMTALEGLKSPEHGLGINMGKILIIPKCLNNCVIEHKQ